MVVLDLVAALDGHLPAALRPGTPMDAVRAALGPPTDRSARFRHGTGIWRYGTIELHFFEGVLRMVFCDADELVGDGGLQVASGWLELGLDELTVRARLPDVRRVPRSSSEFVLLHGPYASLGFDVVADGVAPTLVALTFSACDSLRAC